MNPKELNFFINEGEGLRIEFKEQYSNKIDKDIVAFANSNGGYLFLGVNDEGKITGENLTNNLKAKIVDLARNCEPSIPVERISQIDNVIVIEIKESYEKPHSCARGFFRRLDAITQKMTSKELKLFFNEKKFRSEFEYRIYPGATLGDISKEKVATFLKEAKISIIDFSLKDILTSLNILENSSIKNVGVLFFAKDPQRMISQCQMTCVAYKGTKGIHIYDRVDIQDDLLTQYNAAQTFLQKHLNIRTEIKGFNRQDIYEIPLNALREAIANAIIHRDYSVYGTSLMVEVHADRIEIYNPGGIPEGMDIKSLMKVSIRRNELIADLFARIEKAERLGSGLRRIYDIIKTEGLEPPTIESNRFFRITFKRPFYIETEQRISSNVIEKLSRKKLGETPEIILKEIGIDPYITAKRLSKISGFTLRTIEKNIAKLKADGLIRRSGSRKTGYWEINK